MANYKPELDEWEEFRYLELLEQRKNMQDHQSSPRTPEYLRICASERLEAYMDWEIGFSSLGKFCFKKCAEDMLASCDDWSEHDPAYH